jgi:hypothetical protein
MSRASEAVRIKPPESDGALQLNVRLLQVIGELWRDSGEAAVSVDDGRERRTLHVLRGRLIGADSNITSELLGELLVSRGLLDPVLIAPMSAEAKRHGRLLGDQLLADKLLSSGELLSVLDHQAFLRFERALTMAGEVFVAGKAVVRAGLVQPLGPLTLRAFRERIPLDAVHAFHVGRGSPSGLLKLSQDVEHRLRLLPFELRLARDFSHGARMTQQRPADPASEVRLRFGAALMALELWC